MCPRQRRPSGPGALCALVLVATAVAQTPAGLHAQPRLLVGGGISTPSGAFAGDANRGRHARLGLQLGVPGFPLRFHGEAEADLFDEKGGGETRIFSGTLSAALSLGGAGLDPYVLGGLGTYWTEGAFGPADLERGYHAGFGVNLGSLGVGLWAEARIVRVAVAGGGNRRWIPVTLGLRF